MGVTDSVILLVEDEIIIAAAEENTISKFGYEVVLAHSGEEAVERALADRRISLILIDIDLGDGIDGAEAARRILAERDIPIVFLTSHTEQAMVERVKEITRYGYVVKNSGAFVLRSSIEMAFALFDAHTRLRRQTRRLEDALDKGKIAWWEMELPAGTVTFHPHRAEMLGRNPEEFSSAADFSALVHPEDTGRLLEVENALVKRQDDACRVSYRIRHADGSYRWNEDVGTVIERSADGGAVRIVGLVQDITERKQSEEALAFQAELLDAVGQAVVAIDPGGLILYWNRGAAELCGWPREEAVGADLVTLLADDDAERGAEGIAKITEHLRTGAPWSGRISLRHKNGGAVSTDVSTRCVRDDRGNLKAVIAVATSSDRNSG